MSSLRRLVHAFRDAPAWFRGTAFLVLMLGMFQAFAALGYLILSLPPRPSLVGPAVFCVIAIPIGLLATRLAAGSGDALRATGVIPGPGTASRFLQGTVIAAVIWGVNISVIAVGGGGLGFERVAETGLTAGVLTLMLMIAQSAMEEIAFRGYALTTLRERYGVWPAVLLTTIAFIAYHILGGQDVFSSVVGTGIGGLLFAMAALAGRGLALPIAVHGIFNYLNWAAGDKVKYGEGFYRTVVDEASMGRLQTVGLISYVTVLSLGALVLYLWYRRSERA